LKLVELEVKLQRGRIPKMAVLTRENVQKMELAEIARRVKSVVETILRDFPVAEDIHIPVSGHEFVEGYLEKRGYEITSTRKRGFTPVAGRKFFGTYYSLDAREAA